MKTVIITGSSRGIGYIVAQRCLAQGMRVIGIARKADRVFQGNDQYIPFNMDFSFAKTCEKHFRDIAKQYPEVDAIVCNAGCGLFGELEQISLNSHQDMMNIGLHTHSMLVKAFIPRMKAKKQGKLIFMGSEAALKGSRRGSLYCSIKFAIRGLAQALRDELRSYNIPVCLINPGLVRTEFFDNLQFSHGTDPENVIEPEHVADAMMLMMNMPYTTVIEEINMQPMRPAIVRRDGSGIEAVGLV